VVIKHAEGKNIQNLAWKFLVVEQNVQCWDKQKGLLMKEKNSNQKESSND